MLEANQGHAVLSRLAQFHPTQSLESHTLEYYRGLNNQQYHFEVHLRYHIRTIILVIILALILHGLVVSFMLTCSPCIHLYACLCVSRTRHPRVEGMRSGAPAFGFGSNQGLGNCFGKLNFNRKWNRMANSPNLNPPKALAQSISDYKSF